MTVSLFYSVSRGRCAASQESHDKVRSRWERFVVSDLRVAVGELRSKCQAPTWVFESSRGEVSGGELAIEDREFPFQSTAARCDSWVGRRDGSRVMSWLMARGA